MKRLDLQPDECGAAHDVDLGSAIERLFAQVWEAALGDCVRAAESEPIDAASARPLHALVSIRGAWNGDLVLECPVATVREFGSAWYRRQATALDEHELEATLFELVNIFGGNLKGLLPGRNEISLPRRMDGSEAVPAVLAGARRIDLGLSFRGWPVVLRIYDLNRSA